MTAIPPTFPADGGSWRQQTLQAGLDLLDQGLTVFDASLHLVAWNRAFLELLAFPPEMTRIGAPFEDFIRYNARRGEYGDEPEDEAVRRRVDLALKFLPHDIERTRPDGRILRITGQPLPGHGFVTLYSDVTEQRRTEQALRQANLELESRVRARTAELQRSEQQMRLVTDSIPALVAYFRRDRGYEYINRGYQDWFGLDPKRPEQVSARAFLGPEVYEGIKPNVKRALAGESVTFDYELHTVQGETLSVRTTLIPDRTADGEVVGCFELTFDVTEQKRSQALIERAQKMEAMGQLAGGLAHDFNNILTVIIGNLAALGDARPQDQLVSEFTQPAVAAARRGAELIRGLMTFARQQPLQAAAVDVGALVSSVVRLVRPALPACLTLQAHAGDDAAWTWVDATQLENALVNLILNARDATPGSGRIDVRVRCSDLDGVRARALQLQTGPHVCIEVQDQGVGMDAATLARVFEPFFTTKRHGSGTGLGMAMVYGFVRQSGGAVDVRSTPGQGTTVSLWLPATEAPAELPALDEPGHVPGSARRGVALLVEDDGDVRKVVRRSLLDLGFAVIEAANGHEAQEILAQMSGITLLLSDIMMPGDIDGRVLARQARERGQAKQVLLMSGYAPGIDTLTDLPLLAKPFTTSELAAAIEELTV
ncbi:PAS-domain containing protein [uncultured Aquabacterium sp.]|uniref:PAS-domain containing protein n=1 Tax=uncultured Aquabacterium sp. TaxID=158753 RepID=UPI00262CB22C|nr:PAS-domain containing protein [uncultured Aquabacterium sp.]